MKKYAMILNDRVIDIVLKDFPPVYPPTPEGNQITAMICDDTVMVGDIVVDGEIIGTAPKPQPTQLDNIEEGQLIIMEAMADQYEQSVETELTNMEVMATIYEQLLAMEGVE